MGTSFSSKRAFNLCISNALAIVAMVAFVGISCSPTSSGNKDTARADATVSSDLTGDWQSVDFVRTIDAFQPGTQSWQGDLFLKSLQCNADGSMSHPCTWKDGIITDTQSGYQTNYIVKSIDGETYLFFPWISGDVTLRGMEPQYYVLKKV